MLFFRSQTVVAAAILLASFPALAADSGLVLKRVMLSTGGVGYFEYEATVSGAADLFLDVRRDRVDDVLKSIVVYDDKGGIGTISLPGREPLREMFRELPFGQEALRSPEALLGALRGSEVRLGAPQNLVGRLVAVTSETKELANNAGRITQHRLSVMTADGLRQAILEDVDTLKFTDTKLQTQVDAALAALAHHGERERRTLTLHTTGSGARTVRVAYVVEAPLWKTAYRLTLDAGGASNAANGKGGLQGWAVLENLSGEDWKDVDLTVVSGNPVTFRQALYDAYYVSRPNVPVEVLGRMLPKVDEGAIAQAVVPQISGNATVAAQAAAPAYRKTRSMAIDEEDQAPGAPHAAAASPHHSAVVHAAESTEATTQVTFHYPQSVSVENGHSLLMPIVNRTVPVERLALYQPHTQPRHPLASVRLSNDGASLPPGILTLYERGADGLVSYVGDARLAAFPAGQNRLLSFADDQKVTIDHNESQTDSLTRVRLSDGVLEALSTDRSVTTYTIAGASHEARKVLIEYSRRPGWDLVPGATGASAVETTADAYRIPADVPAGKIVTVVVTTEHPRLDRLEMTEMNSNQLDFYASARDLPSDLRQSLNQIVALRSAVADRERVVSRLETEQNDIEKDQQRLRNNLSAVGHGSDIGRRYVAKLNEQEDRLEKLTKALAEARAGVETARGALAEGIKGIKVGG
ncbi:MAG: DUF4139 domain-containing protein [Alphaproteobacteria bacterium]|nr:DUF4139 domain-containing protein [Alphaproteobacteria bacterium]